MCCANFATCNSYKIYSPRSISRARQFSIATRVTLFYSFESSVNDSESAAALRETLGHSKIIHIVRARGRQFSYITAGDLYAIVNFTQNSPSCFH